MNLDAPDDAYQDWGEQADRAADELAAGHAPELPNTEHDEEGQRVVAGLRALYGALAATAEEQALVEGESLPHPVLPDDYQVINEIGRGGMGVVYRAKRLADGAVVAIKVLHPAQSLFGESIRRFRREAATLARLEHPNIVKMHEVAEHNGQIYLVMECVDGRPLDELLADEGALPPQRALAILRQVAAAVAYVHTHDIVHRDLKPGNVLVDARDHAYVTDFGLAFELGSETGLTLTGQVLGTPAYMSPEQARGDGDAVDERSDVYAMGVMLYECLTGKRPFEGLSPPEQVYAVIHRVPRPPRSVRRGIPRDLQTICQKAMQKRPSWRYGSARAFLEDLQRAAKGRPILARPPSRAYRLGRFARRHRVSLTWATALLVLGLSLGLGLSGRTRRATAELLRAADALVEADRLDDAIRTYEHVLEEDGDSARASRGIIAAYVRRARAQWSDDLREEARASLTRASSWAGKDGARHPIGAVEWTTALFDALSADDLGAVLSDTQNPIRQGLCDAMDRWRAETEAQARRIWRAGGPAPHMPMLDTYRQALALLRRPLRDPSSNAGRIAMLELRCMLQAASQPEFLHQLSYDVLLPDAVHGYVEALLRAAYAPEAPEHERATLSFLLPTDQRHTLWDGPILVTPTQAAEALARTALGDGGLPVRRAAAVMLAQLANLPFEAAFAYDKFHETDLDPASVAKTWRRLDALPAEEAFAERARIAMAATELAVAQGRHPSDLVHWCRRTLGPLPQSPVALLEWWAKNREKSPRRWLFDLLSQPASDWSDAGDLLAAWRRTKHEAFESLLAMLAPPDVSVPHRSLRANNQERRLLAWKLVLGRPVVPLRARLGAVAFENGRWVVDASAEEFSTLPTAIGAHGMWPAFTLEREMSATPPALSWLALKLAGGATRITGSKQTQTLAGHLEYDEVGTRFRIEHSIRRGSGYSSTNSSSNQDLSVDFVLSPDLRVLGYSKPDYFRHQFSLLAFEPVDAPNAPWTLEDWRRGLIRTLETLAEGVTPKAGEDRSSIPPSERYAYDHQHELRIAAAIAARIPLPEAQDALRTIASALPGTLDDQPEAFAMARLFAGDESALDGADAVRFPKRGSFADMTIGREGEGAVRLLRLTKSERIRAFALAHLKEKGMSDIAAGDLLDAVRAGEVTVPDWLMTRLDDGPTEDRSWWGQLRLRSAWLWLAALLWGFTLLALLMVVWPGRTPSARLVPAAWLVALGVVIASLAMTVGGVDTMPDIVGYALAALGSWRLARAARVRPLAAVFFLGAAALLAVKFVPLPPEASVLVDLLHGICVVLALTALLPLAAHLRGTRQGERARVPRLFLLIYTLPMLVAFGIGFYFLVTGDLDGRIDLGGWGTAWFVGILICLLYLLVTLVRSARVRKVWRKLRRPDEVPLPA